MLSVPLSHCASVLKLSALISAFSAPLRFNCISFAFAALYSRLSAATTPQYARGGHTRTNRCTQWHQPKFPRCNSVISALCSRTSAGQFGGKSSQLAFLRRFSALLAQFRRLIDFWLSQLLNANRQLLSSRHLG